MENKTTININKSKKTQGNKSKMKQQLITVSFRHGKLRPKYQLALRKASTSSMSTGNCGTHTRVPLPALAQEYSKN